VKETAESEWLG